MNLKKTCIALALAGGLVSTANAAPTVISLGGTSATIADSGLFSSSTALGLSNGGLEYINLARYIEPTSYPSHVEGFLRQIYIHY